MPLVTVILEPPICAFANPYFLCYKSQYSNPKLHQSLSIVFFTLLALYLLWHLSSSKERQKKWWSSMFPGSTLSLSTAKSPAHLASARRFVYFFFFLLMNSFPFSIRMCWDSFESFTADPIYGFLLCFSMQICAISVAEFGKFAMFYRSFFFCTWFDRILFITWISELSLLSHWKILRLYSVTVWRLCWMFPSKSVVNFIFSIGYAIFNWLEQRKKNSQSI